MLFGIKFNPMATFDIFLYFHSHDVSVDGEGHLVGHWVDLTLFLFDSATHVVKTFFNRELKLFFRLNFFCQSLLELVWLISHLLVVPLKVGIQCINLVLLSYGSLEMSFDGTKCSLQVIIFSLQLIKYTMLSLHLVLVLRCVVHIQIYSFLSLAKV